MIYHAHFLADDLIRQWLAGVESATSPIARGSGGDHTLLGGSGEEGIKVGQEDTDFLSSVDWLSDDVGQSTREVLKGLLNKELKCGGGAAWKKKKSYDPVVTMEMRHREVQ